MYKILVMRQSGCIKEELLYRDAVVPYILFVANNDWLIKFFTSCLVDEKRVKPLAFALFLKLFNGYLTTDLYNLI